MSCLRTSIVGGCSVVLTSVTVTTSIIIVIAQSYGGPNSVLAAVAPMYQALALYIFRPIWYALLAVMRVMIMTSSTHTLSPLILTSIFGMTWYLGGWVVVFVPVGLWVATARTLYQLLQKYPATLPVLCDQFSTRLNLSLVLV